MPVAVAARRAASRTAVPGPQPTSTTRSAAVRSAASATARTRVPCPAVIHSAVMTWQARPAIPAPARCVLVLLVAGHLPSARTTIIERPCGSRRGWPSQVRMPVRLNERPVDLHNHAP